MTARSIASFSQTDTPSETSARVAIAPWEAESLAHLRQWFGVEFHLFSGATGELLHGACDQRGNDWSERGTLCRAVAARGRSECIEDNEPLLTLAIPITGPARQVVAVGVFATSHLLSDARLPALAGMLGLNSVDVGPWVARQACWNGELLIHMGQMAAERLSLETRARVLEKEARDLSSQLSKTYEEISLLYRLTQNLKLSSRDEDLAVMALEWLAEVVPAESLCIQLTAPSRGQSLPSDGRVRPALLNYGAQLLTCDELTRLIEYCELKPGGRPLIVNPPITTSQSWPWPSIRELIVISLCEGENCFGWLVVCNHQQGEEFGTVEASLLSSVAAILGIHSGNAELYHQQREFFAGVVRALTSAIDAKDPYTCGHSDRVARVAVRLATELGLDSKQIDTIYLSGLLHDVGKIGIDDNVLRKPGKLTEAEYEHIKSHTEIGHKILSGIKQLDDVLPVVLHHHEQWDGRGYPCGLAGEGIPLLARIVAVADSFDAMSSDRPYRKGIDDARLDAILRQGAGTQWDAEIIDAFFRIRGEVRQLGENRAEPLPLESRD